MPVDEKSLVEHLKTVDGLGAEDIVSIVSKVEILYDHKNGPGSYRKDTMPNSGIYPPPGGRVLDGGPFSLINETVFNGIPVNNGGNAISRWLPTNKMQGRKKEVQHLEFIVPEGFDPTLQTYGEWLNGLSIGECGYGPATTWSGFRYQMEGGSFSMSTQMLKQIEDGGLPYYESMPLGFGYDLVGADGSTLRIDNDGDWALALILMASEEHLNYVTTYGYNDNSDMEWDGISAIVTQGYVEAHAVGRGIPHWANPIIADGSGIVAVAELIGEIHQQVRHIRRRASMKNWPIAVGDMVIYMSSMMWDNLAAAVASGALEQHDSNYGFVGGITIDVYLERLRSIRSGGFGTGVMDVDGIPIYIIPDPNMGVNSTITIAGTPTNAVTSDVFILTRQAGNFQLWSHDFLDYSDLKGPQFNNERFSIQNGFGKAGYITEANMCYYYYLQMVGRLTCNMLPLQGRITSASLPVLDQYGMEAPSFASPEFYPLVTNGDLFPIDAL